MPSRTQGAGWYEPPLCTHPSTRLRLGQRTGPAEHADSAAGRGRPTVDRIRVQSKQRQSVGDHDAAPVWDWGPGHCAGGSAAYFAKGTMVHNQPDSKVCQASRNCTPPLAPPRRRVRLVRKGWVGCHAAPARLPPAPGHGQCTGPATVRSDGAPGSCVLPRPDHRSGHPWVMSLATRRLHQWDMARRHVGDEPLTAQWPHRVSISWKDGILA